ncbi:MAG TPA: BtrH N-terminal domain-containing protein, partial [Candidatus Limnocylindrales bacterium]|nr:BtrH N-terminal domain-containing protein [Candidatus Limnocylindrales bacterium]
GAAGTGGYAFRGGLHPDTSMIANILANQGVRSELTGRPLSEAAILGAGGGLGAGYILWEFRARAAAILTLGFRNQWQYPAVPGWLAKTADRLAIRLDVHETGGPAGARMALDAILDTGRPVIAYVDQQVIGTWGQPAELSGVTGYPVVVVGRLGDDGYLVDDRGKAALEVPATTMVAARARIGTWRNRLVELTPPGRVVPAASLRAAFRAGLEDQVDHLRAPSDSFSLPTWRKWSRLLTDTRNPKAWSRVFPGGRGLFGALLSIVEAVDGTIGAQGGHLRELYADFLDEAAPTLDAPALNDAARAWRTAADLWEDLADAAVPADLDGAVDVVEAAEALHDGAMAGEPGRAGVADAAGKLWSARAAYAGELPLEPARIEALYADLGERISRIYQAECEAVESTAAAIGR